MRVAVCLLVFFFVSCASLPSYPYPACLHSGDARGLFRKGSVIAEREDGSLLFKFDDSTAGDKGFQWVPQGDSHLRPCMALGVAGDITSDSPFRRE